MTTRLPSKKSWTTLSFCQPCESSHFRQSIYLSIYKIHIVPPLSGAPSPGEKEGLKNRTDQVVVESNSDGRLFQSETVEKAIC